MVVLRGVSIWETLPHRMPASQPPRPTAPSGTGPPRRRRRRRRGAAAPPTPTLVPQTGALATTRAGDAPLSAAEIDEMKQHLLFFRTYKDHLRLKLNAAEDLLVNGHRDPDDRGICKHLLGKLDRSVVERALERDPMRSDAGAKARFLAGAIHVSADVGVLLDYLEALAGIRSRSDAAAAFAEVVRRIDFESLSGTRLGRLLQVLVETFSGHERVQVLFSLLGTKSFARAFDAAEAAFPADVAAVCLPLRSVHRHIRRQEDHAPPAQLAAGVEQVFSAPDGVLRGYSDGVRLSLLDLALGPAVPAALAERAVKILLPSIPRASRDHARLALRYAAYRMRDRADEKAKVVLEELHRAQPDLRVARRWLDALSAWRMGRIAVTGKVIAGTRLADAFWLDAQRPVWLRMAASRDTDRLSLEGRLQFHLGLPGVAAVVEQGVEEGIPYVAMAAPGTPLLTAQLEGLDFPTTFAVVAEIAKILRAVALAGIALPDAVTTRFLFDERSGTLTLADFDGARSVGTDAATAAHAAHIPAVITTMVPAGAAAGLGTELERRIARLVGDAASELAPAVTTLARAALLAAALR